MQIWCLFMAFVMGMLVLWLENNRQRFPCHIVPSRKVFVTVFNKLCDSGELSSTHIRSERASRQEVDEIENILDLVEENRGTSSRRISAQFEIPQTRLIRALHENI